MNATATSTRALRIVAILTIALVAFVATYSIANAANGPARTAAPSSGQASPAAFAGDSSASPACACCGGAASSEPVEGSATLDGDVQRITVDTSAGFYNPNIIALTAGVPAEITFTSASGCLAQVMSEDLGFFEDLTAGDVTVRLDGLQPGTYEFSCGMQMVFGTIIVE